MKLYASGFNAHAQLQLQPSSEQIVQEVMDFRVVVEERKDIRILATFWSQTVLTINGDLVLLGAHATSMPFRVDKIISIAGTHDGLRVVTVAADSSTDDGPNPPPNLYVFDPDKKALSLLTKAHSPAISHVAITSAERVAVCVNSAPGASTFHLLEFGSLSSFLKWHEDAGSSEGPLKHHQTGSRCESLQATATGFVVLREDGEVYTWGDGRYPGFLGRDGEPGTLLPVDTLSGLNVKKICTCASGWCNGAITAANEAYLWGPFGGPGALDKDGDLEQALLEGQVVKVDLSGGPVDSVAEDDLLDIVDLAIGLHHAIAVESESTVWIRGNPNMRQMENIEQQDSVDTRALQQWRRLSQLDLRRKVQVAAGDSNSYIVSS